jgi:membrane protease YdiL (CAAX protease family)
VMSMAMPFIFIFHSTGSPPAGVSITTSAAALWSALAVGVSVPIWEELLFRGFLYRGFSESRLDAVGAILLTGVTWGLLHAWKGPVGMAETALVGVGLGWLRVYTGSTFAPLASHILNNGLFALAMIFAA